MVCIMIYWALKKVSSCEWLPDMRSKLLIIVAAIGDKYFDNITLW